MTLRPEIWVDLAEHYQSQISALREDSLAWTVLADGIIDIMASGRILLYGNGNSSLQLSLDELQDFIRLLATSRVNTIGGR